MKRFLNIFYVNFRKDAIISLSYKFSFISEFLFILPQVFIFYFLIEFVRGDDLLLEKNNDYFQYVLIGMCFIDILNTIIIRMSNQILELKTSGILEEIICLNRYIDHIFGISAYPIVISILKFLIYYSIGYILLGYPFINITFKFLLIFALLIMSFVFIGIMAVAFTIRFYKARVLPSVFLFLCVIFGQAYFPNDYLHQNAYIISNMLSFNYGLSAIREINEFSQDVLFINNQIYGLFLLCSLYGLIAIFCLKKSILFSKKNATLLHY